MKTIEELIQEALDHGIVDQQDELPYMDGNGEYMALDGYKLRRWLETVLKPARESKGCHYTELPDGKVNIVIPPNYFVSITGMIEARQDNTGAVRLVDVEGNAHKAMLDLNIVETAWVNICDAVTRVRGRNDE